jgi:hypothetical protein
LACKLLVVYREQALKANPAVFQALRLAEGLVDPEAAVVDSVGDAAAEVEGALAAGVAAVSAAREDSAAGQAGMADSLAIARIAGGRASMATCRSSGRAPTPTPSSSP